MQPEVPFSTTTVENLKWFGQELTELWKDKSNDKEKIFIYFAIDPKGQRDLQGDKILYDLKVTWISHISPTKLWLYPM